MKKLYKEGDPIELLNVGDIIEIYSGIFVVIKEINEIIEEELGDLKKTSMQIKTEIIAK